MRFVPHAWGVLLALGEDDGAALPGPEGLGRGVKSANFWSGLAVTWVLAVDAAAGAGSSSPDSEEVTARTPMVTPPTRNRARSTSTDSATRRRRR